MTDASISKITPENVEDIIATAEYGGITGWAVEASAEDFDSAPEGTRMTFRDDEGNVHHLNADQIRQATVEIAEGTHTNTQIRGYVINAFDGWTEEDGIDCGEIDADAADCIVQVACFGEVVYG